MTRSEQIALIHIAIKTIYTALDDLTETVKTLEDEVVEYDVIPTENGETLQEVEALDLDSEFNELVDKFDSATTIREYESVGNFWSILSQRILEAGEWDNFEEDMAVLRGDINAAIKSLTPAPTVKPAEKVPTSTVTQAPLTTKPKPSVSLKPKELQAPVEGESVSTYVVRVLKNDFSYNPTLNAKVFRVPNADALKVHTQLKPYITKFFPEYVEIYSARQNNKDVDLNFPQRVPSVITETTSTEDAIKRIRTYYNLIDIGLCEDNTEEYDCAADIAGILIDLAAEEGDIDLTKPLETYIELEEGE